MCGKETYGTRKRKYCSAKCTDKNYSKTRVIDCPARYKKQRVKKVTALLTKKNKFSKTAYAYNDMCVPYRGSPEGKAYIGLAKAPLMPSKTGIGFHGVKLQSVNREVIECSECGKWFKALHSHLNKVHGMSAAEYKEKHGLMKSENLLSDIHSNFLADNFDKVKKVGFGVHRLGPKHISPGNRGTAQRQNSHGTCPLQLEAAMVNYINRFKRIPSSHGHGRDVFDKFTVFVKRFGSINNALKTYGLPTRHKFGRGSQYVFPNGESMIVKEGLGLEAVYDKMKKECKILSKQY